MIPPPNVTGSLHMGHALTFTVQDALVRWRRMQGRDTLWQPGTDHAGIATQMVVERLLAERGNQDRRALGRDAFVERIWQWKAESGGTITRQLRRLGASLDWPRERFTMDPGLSAAVRKVFVTLYREGLIYRDRRLVNWDPKLLTAISDLEVENRRKSAAASGTSVPARYPACGREPAPDRSGVGERPGHPPRDPSRRHRDRRASRPDAGYRHLIGRTRHPAVGRPAHPDHRRRAFRSRKGQRRGEDHPGARFQRFRCRPAAWAADAHRAGPGSARHAERDRTDIAAVEGIADPGFLRALDGKDRFAARKAIVAELERLGLLEKTEPHTHQVPHGDRGGVPIEPRLTTQWFCKADILARPAIESVEQGRTVFVPKQWENTFFAWMRDIQPWCISRQLWWGHRIPAWYGPDGQVFVAHDETEVRAEARAAYGREVALTQDEDVLDTWFSSGLWPFSTLGWPEQTKELARYYPTDVLVTGFDIIFFWVARMMMQGLHFMGDVPFRTVYIHGLVRDERGQKMSKSKGNIIDPLELIDRYGADALRFTICALTGPGRDVKLGAARVESYRSFVTKLWNAARFCEMNDIRPDPAFDPRSATLPLTRWILDAANTAVQEATAALEAFRFDEYAAACYRFTWNTYCDWFLEFAKPALAETDTDAAREVRATAAHVLGIILRLLHPAVPFVTEELWDRFGYGAPFSLIRAAWPRAERLADVGSARAELDWVVRLITEVRAVRAEMNVPPGTRAPVLLRDAAAATLARAHDGCRRSSGSLAPLMSRRWMARCRKTRRRWGWTRRRWSSRWPA